MIRILLATIFERQHCHTMALLRSSKLHKKRSSADKATEADQTEPQLSDTQTVDVEAIAPDDSSIIAVPPKALALTKDAIRRDSSPRSLLERYRHRSSSSRSSLELESVSPTAAPATDQRHPASLPINFEALPRALSTEAEMVMGWAPENVNSSEVSPSRDDLRHLDATRKTRSQSRRQNRVDSHDSSAVTPGNRNINTQGNSQDITHKDDNESTELSDMSTDVPRSLSVRKKEASRTPSPRSQTDGETIQPPPRSPARRIAAFLQSSSPNEQSPILSPQPQKALIPAALKDSHGLDVPPRRGASIKERLAFVRAPIPSPPLDAESMMVAVRPPMFDPHKGICQWTSDLPSTSRPDRVWEWPKRWTCCRCDAVTIVEQKVCSNLTCSHYRCPNNGCRMIRVARPLGQFVGFGGS